MDPFGRDFLSTDLNYEIDDEYYTDEFDPLKDDWDGQPKDEECMDYLNNVDYSLNSPLLVDELTELQKFLKGQIFQKRWNEKDWKSIKFVLKEVNYPVASLKNLSNFHKWFGLHNISHHPRLGDIKDLIKGTIIDSHETFPIVKAFVKGWINKDIINPKSTNIPDQIYKWGAYFLDMHHIILLMNSTKGKEESNLIRMLGARIISGKDFRGLSFTTKNFGEVLIIGNKVLLRFHNFMLDRNHILMMKDVYNARFQTLWAMIHRIDDLFKNEDWLIINEIYKIGDQILIEGGNTSYDSIKLIEPISNLRLTQVAHKYRPLIPEFPNFGLHVKASVDEARKITPSIMDLYRAITSEESLHILLTVYGSFRHWGHPHVDYLEGLKKLEGQVNMEKEIDKEYVNALASDMAFIVLESKFKEHKKWYVNKDEVDEKHKLYPHIRDNTWPTPKQISDFGDKWHLLPLIKCFDVPDMVDPSIIYADKSHSMNRTEVVSHVRSGSIKPIPTRKVLNTFINSPATNWKEFLEDIDKNGLDKEHLVIGLKGKERELKRIGRFFSLMSWKLREYFVITEYLIKTHYVPLFKGLTMADDMATLIKKMMDNTSGQGLDDYDRICIANHIDYEKWNNHQRKESNGPIFRVMGQFLGYPTLIERTHEFFEKSLVYYNERPDLMVASEDSLLNNSENMVCWEGQKGGFEGLRQKGWSVVNLLVIRREGINRNTKIKTLAQGDNQVICTTYRLQKTRDDEEMEVSLNRIARNNESVMNAIERGTTKLGLIINKDETMQSADYLNYGKTPVFRGNICGLETKRWSRVACVSNDQLPTLGNILSTVSSNALTVAHFSPSPINTMIHYNLIGNFVRRLLDKHNPALKGSITDELGAKDTKDLLGYKIGALYLDPSIGGISGMSLTRFLIRGFPDPVTESLAFWKKVALNSSGDIRKISIKCGYPDISIPDHHAFTKLIENPLSLNIKHGKSPVSMIKDGIRKSLESKSNEIPNVIVADAVKFHKENLDSMIGFLMSIKPLFPRFLSEYVSATYIGITNGILGLFENSKTIRNVFSNKLSKKIDQAIISSEKSAVSSLIELNKNYIGENPWDCSSSHADLLRERSWGQEVIGATIPHPIEMINNFHSGYEACIGCKESPPLDSYVSVLVPRGLVNYWDHRGPYMAYLGSRTSETTSLLQPWDRETKVPLIRRAAKLRNAINWFVDPSSKLANSIFQNLEALTGEDWSEGTQGFKRTGSAPHRFSCSRQSAGGYAAQSPMKLTRMISTTDTVSTLEDDNYDFMFQSLLIYSQITTGEIHDGKEENGFYHFHITCKDCVRPITNPLLEAENEYSHSPVFERLSAWKPDNIPWAERRPTIQLPEGKWDELSLTNRSYHIGRLQGFLFGESILSSTNLAEQTSLFPLVIQDKLIPKHFMHGILDGLMRACCINTITRRSVANLERPRPALLGTTMHLIEELSTNINVINIWRHQNFIDEFNQHPHKIPASYPMSNTDLGLLGRSCLKSLFKNKFLSKPEYKTKGEELWIFSDVNQYEIVALLGISSKLLPILFSNSLKKSQKDRLRELKELVHKVRDPDHPAIDIKAVTQSTFRVDREVRHVCKGWKYNPPLYHLKSTIWQEEETGKVHGVEIPYKSGTKPEPLSSLPVPRIQDPLISGLRLFQCATGSHYKLRSILKEKDIDYRDALVGGDGSGGIGSMILRYNKESRLIFNSLLELENVDLKGSSPSGPAAICMIPGISSRCVNTTTAWQEPTDLSQKVTWDNFKRLKEKHHMNIDLMIFDMEVREGKMSRKIEEYISEFIYYLLEEKGTLIYKTYLNDILNSEGNILTTVGQFFQSVEVLFTDFTSSHSSEVYVLMRRLSNTSIPLVPDLFELIDNLGNFPVYSTPVNEFNRALRVSNLNMYKGVPRNFIRDGFIDMSTTMITLGVETGTATLLGEMVRDKVYARQHGETPYVILFLALNSILWLSRGSNTTRGPPSDKRVFNVGALVVGFGMWLSLNMNNLDLKVRLQRMINQHFPFSRKQVQTRGLYYSRYSFLGKYDETKNFHLDNNMASIGNIIRVFSHVFGSRLPDANPDIIDRQLTSLDKGLNLRIIGITTDILLLYKTTNTPQFTKAQLPGPEDYSDDNEGAYMN